MTEILTKLKNLVRKITPSFLINWYHFLLVFFGAVIYGFPGKKLKVIGVTGTNGKSTVVEMISHILEGAGFKVASFSSIRFKIGQKEQENTLKMTMPGRFILQKLLREAIDANCDYVILEVTSEGIKQHRHRFIDFQTAVFTNLSPEHIEAHGSFEKYREAKEKLFETTKTIHILNLDDDNTKHFLKYSAEKKYGYGLGTDSLYSVLKKDEIPKYKILATNCKISTNGISFEVDDVFLKLNLLGVFNIHNALAAICVGISLGASLETCKKALEEIKGISGRMEQVISEPFKVLVDYAFTPNALEKVYQTVQETIDEQLKGRMVCVLGAAGGGRDKWKRKILGEIAAKYCDEVIVTDEDPYDEDPIKIIDQVAEGAGLKAKKILDRRQAIKKALRDAKKGDRVIITGKGCEPWICVANGRKIPWDDRKVVREEFKKLANIHEPITNFTNGYS